MADDKQRQPDPTANEAFGSAGKETGLEEPSETGTAGLYATPVHEEGEEALREGQRTEQGRTR